MAAAVLVAGILALDPATALSAEAATANDTARFLAGLPPAADSSLAAMTNDPAWRQHAGHFNALFEREESATLAKVRAFSQAYLTEKHETMLYMFSGPDFLYASSFFPDASIYVLSGLEPVGDIPPLDVLRPPVVHATLRNLETSLNSVLSFSFFITKNMKTQLHTGPVFGTLPILYVFLARTGKTIHDVSFVSLDENGNVHAPDDSDISSADEATKGAFKRAAQSNVKGVKIAFSDGSHPNQTLYYFSTNLADEGVKRSGFLAFCDRLGVGDSLIKSASYLLHRSSFARIRSFLLNHSATILEDDSGIPLAFFDSRKWRLQPLGRYVGPISQFARYYQSKMAQLFSADNPIPLDFGIGYRWRTNESNLLLAVKSARTDDNKLTSPW